MSAATPEDRRALRTAATAHGYTSVGCKGIADGAKALPEVAQRLRRFADWIESLNDEFRLAHEVEDDFIDLEIIPRRRRR